VPGVVLDELHQRLDRLVVTELAEAVRGPDADGAQHHA
jgi:hypothetical protein